MNPKSAEKPPRKRMYALRSCHAPAFYASVYAGLRGVARRAGYALAIHGSMMKDLDLVAVPWTDEAIPQVDLVNRLIKRCRGWIAPTKNPGKKPHGRRAYTIHLDATRYIDLSVIARKVARRGGRKGTR